MGLRFGVIGALHQAGIGHRPTSVEKKPRDIGGAGLVTGGILLLLAVAGLSFAPLWPCPSCYDADLSYFNCDICRGSNQPAFRRNISFWKRWEGVREFQSYGNKRIRLWLPSQD